MIGNATDEILVNGGPAKHGPAFVEDGGEAPSGLSRAPKLIDRIDVKVEAVLGGASLTIKALDALTTDSILKLDATLNAPVDIRLNGVVVARGDLVAVGDRFGVRIVEIG